MIKPVRPLGYTLIEVVIVMSIGSTVMLAAVSWIHRSLHLTSQIHSSQQHQASLVRLAQCFRQDVRDAQQATLDGPLLTLQRLTASGTSSDTAGSQVEYQIDESRIERLETLASGQIRRESFPLADGSRARWRVEPLPQAVELRVIRSPGTRQRRASQATSAATPTTTATATLDQQPTPAASPQPPDDLRLTVALNRYARQTAASAPSAADAAAEPDAATEPAEQQP